MVRLIPFLLMIKSLTLVAQLVVYVVSLFAYLVGGKVVKIYSTGKVYNY